MAFGIFIHRTDSIYEDVPSEQYQFPKLYLSRVQECVGDWIVYLEPSKVKNTKGYFAVARVQKVVEDPKHEGMYLAKIEPGTYLDFGSPVPFKNENSIFERGLINERGRLSGRAQAAVRSLSAEDFSRIVEYGLGREDDLLPRISEYGSESGFSESSIGFGTISPRERISHITNRTVRDRNFRRTVLRAYGERCAISGLRLINGGGRAEVEAAHVRPVERDGPDIVSNGIALSGTAHWMFDRGLVGLSDDLEILVSRHANDVEAVRTLINDTGKLFVPERQSERPRGEFVTWHRENCFKQ